MGLLPPHFQPKRILDFGCGIGDTTKHLAAVFAEAEVIGVGEADKAVDAPGNSSAPHACALSEWRVYRTTTSTWLM